MGSLVATSRGQNDRFVYVFVCFFLSFRRNLALIAFVFNEFRSDIQNIQTKARNLQNSSDLICMAMSN